MMPGGDMRPEYIETLHRKTALPIIIMIVMMVSVTGMQI